MAQFKSGYSRSDQALPIAHLGWGVVAFILIIQFWSRYVPTPWVAFVADDWPNLARSMRYVSDWDAFRVGLTDPNRPLSMAMVEWTFRLFGRTPWPWTVLSLIGNALLLLLLMKMCMEVTGRRCAAVLAGIVFALLPNLTETYHWSTQVLNEVSCALVFYTLSGWMWVAYVRRGGGWRLAISAFAYLIGLFSYEAGIFLPAAYVVLLPWRRVPVGSALRMAPYALVLILYLAWRMTDAFGMNQTWHYPPHMEAGLSLWGISWNVRETINWWVGDHMFGSMLSGFRSFAALPPWTRRLLVLANVVVAALLGWFVVRVLRRETVQAAAMPFSNAQVVLFGVVWTGAAMAIPVLSYTASRLNVLPAMGVSLLAALMLVRMPVRSWGGLLFVPVVLAMISNQGTTESFRQAGELKNRLYAHLEETVNEWRETEVILFDTRSMRNRLTPGLLRPIGSDPATWATYNNALLFRGFVPNGMIQLITKQQEHGYLVVHDVEYGARIKGDTLHWHDRYNPERPRMTPMCEVFVVDVHTVGTGR